MSQLLHLYPHGKRRDVPTYKRLGDDETIQTRAEWEAEARRNGRLLRVHNSEAAARRYSRPDPEVMAILGDHFAERPLPI